MNKFYVFIKIVVRKMELNNSEKAALLGKFKIDFKYTEADYLENFNCF